MGGIPDTCFPAGGQGTGLKGPRPEPHPEFSVSTVAGTEGG